VPRLTAAAVPHERSLPLGPEVWGISRVLLPPDLAGLAWRNLFTGERLESVRKGNEAWLFLATVFGTCPVAVLRAEK
jgi:hypothetical protein